MVCLSKRFLFLTATSISVLVSLHSNVNAQEFGIEKGVSEKELLRMGNFRGALKDYLLLLDADKDNLEYKHIIAQCYLKINGDKSLAIPYLESVWEEDQSNPEVLADLAKANHFILEFDKAISCSMSIYSWPLIPSL